MSFVKNIQILNKFDLAIPFIHLKSFQEQIKKNTFSCLLGCTVHKCSYLKISVSVRILPLYESLALKFWKVVIFQRGSIKPGIFKSILLLNVLFLNYALLHRFSRTINNMKTPLGMLEIHLHSKNFKYIIRFKLCFDNNTFSSSV